VNRHDVWLAVDHERSLLTDDLSRLDDSQWDIQSLCGEWKIRHVVAHLAFEANAKLGTTVLGVVRHGMNVNRSLAHTALSAGAADPADLLSQLKGTVGSRTILPFTKTECAIAEMVCHGADIRRPLGLSRLVPESALVAAADVLRSDWVTGTKRRITGLRLSAIDSDWSVGDGPEVEGPLESLILAMGGRSDPLSELSGEGLPALRSRVAQTIRG